MCLVSCTLTWELFKPMTHIQSSPEIGLEMKELQTCHPWSGFKKALMNNSVDYYSQPSAFSRSNGHTSGHFYSVGLSRCPVKSTCCPCIERVHNVLLSIVQLTLMPDHIQPKPLLVDSMSSRVERTARCTGFVR